MTMKDFLFRYDEEKCINCGLCGKVCPGNGALEPSTNQKVSLAYSKNKKVLEKSASGGMFYPLAKNIIAKNGVVFGARLQNGFKVVHDYVDSVDKLPRFMGSKYIQSEIGDCYKKAKEFLEDGRWVLFSGVPCQILGLRKYLGKEYERLVAVNLICNSVPSPLVF